MESLYLLIPLAILLAVIIGAAFWWSVHAGQFENLDEIGRQVIDDNE